MPSVLVSVWKLARPNKEILVSVNRTCVGTRSPTPHSHITKTPRKDQASSAHSGHKSLLSTDHWECLTSSDNKSVLPILGYLRTVTSQEASQPGGVNARSPKTRPASPPACKSLFMP